MVEAPMVRITLSQIFVDGVPATDTASIAAADRVQRIEEFFNLLKNKRELWRTINPTKPFPGVVVLAIDGRVPASVTKSAVHTATLAGFPHVSWMVRRRKVTATQLLDASLSRVVPLPAWRGARE